ncbi:hypothetical protein LDENG_00063830 [Lucifuga dentata]|nr:hypothetical protein LDENG_00063830 [Lucifuga dentata]
MAELGRMVKVSGLPTDIDDGRLKDKLFIHFLRARNGGGEIISITLVKALPGSALITFEESGVAQRVIQHSLHILEVDGKKYQLSVTENCESFEPDKVILSISATVDYSQLPMGRMAMTNLHKRHPDVQISYDATEELCTLRGTYSKVQAALAQLLGHPGDPRSAEPKNKGPLENSGSSAVCTAQRPRTEESQDQKWKLKEQREHRGQDRVSRPSDDYSSSSHRDLTSGDHSGENSGQLEGAALQLHLNPAVLDEDFSLSLDADMFQYLQKHCREEYQHILSQYGVELVDMTTGGVTTVFLQIATAVGEDGGEQERLRLACRDIQKLHQENEVKICRVQLPKSTLPPRRGLQRVIENLNIRLPKLLLREDDQNIYIIGSSSDVSDAKQFLFLECRKFRDKGENVASLLRYSSFDSGSPSSIDEERVPLALPSSTHSLDGGLNKMKSDEDERRVEGARSYKLAARFKDLGLGGLSRPGDLTSAGISSLSRRPGLGLLGHDVLSATAGFASEELSRAVPQNTGRDILFKSGDASLSSVQNKTSLNSELIHTQQKSTTAPLSRPQSSLSGTTTIPSAEFGSNLKRASSFSWDAGMSQQKAQSMSLKGQDDTEKSTARARGRSSSFSNHTGRDKQEVYKAEITVSRVMWQYIKEAYSARIEDLISDVQVKENRSEDSMDLTVIVRGADSSKVSSCQLRLQKLVSMVMADFSIQEIQLSELGVSDPADENLQICIAQVRSQFNKVTIQLLKESLYVLGPKGLCTLVGDSLREVFSGKSVQIPERQDLPGPSATKWNESIPLKDQNITLHRNGSPQQMQDSQTGEGGGAGNSQERKVHHRGNFCENLKNSGVSETQLVNGSIRQPLGTKSPVVKEKLKSVGTMQLDGQKTKPYISSFAKSGKDVRCENHNWSAAAHTDQNIALHQKERTTQSRITNKDSAQQGNAEIKHTLGGSRSGPGGLEGICVCGESGVSMTRTECGATLCSKCLDKVHVHCRVCHETEPTPQGIQGKMSFSELHINLPGHTKDPAIKITYCIPDGIQGEGHPSPGSPFQGGVFEAYLPDCKRARKLLPRLEKAFRLGLTFTVVGKDAAAKVTWDCIPHKTSLQGGKSGNGYPDSSYLTRLTEVLASHGIEETPAMSQE